MDLSQSFNIKLKNAGKQIFPHIMWFDSKLDHNSGLHAKNHRDISTNKVRTWTYHKVFEKMQEKCGKSEGENYSFPTLVFSKTRSQFRSACKKTERNL